MSYVGNIDWGDLADHIEAIYSITQGHLMLEVNVTKDKFCIAFQTLIRGESYLEAFLQALQEEGIPYELGEKEESRLPLIKMV